ncbi:hypothetical protein [Pseudoalteromonas rhizosphaerae]|uniref:hypothetical protein n=1 Tax=Pseudoalteromonas rhizosphaerae TaxID=2518973 RepID=UPI001230CD6B|nr:hypothetical protein [Pseudoalteromonas rhizosphaerae]
MKWTESTVTKLLIKDVDGLDPITVYIENYALGQGKLTIVICGESYSAHWNAMGSNTLEQFVLKSDNHYLSKNLVSRAKLSEPDYDGFIINIKKQLIEQRRRWGGTKTGIRELWNKLSKIEPQEEYFSRYRADHNILIEVAGDEWWHSIPEVDSSLYKYLCKILDALKACLSERAGVLKPYQVGENDIVLAFNEQSAKQVLCDYCDWDIDDPFDVEDLSNRLDMKFQDEEGNFLYTLKTLIEQDQDQGERYLTGWE